MFKYVDFNSGAHWHVMERLIDYYGHNPSFQVGTKVHCHPDTVSLARTLMALTQRHSEDSREVCVLGPATSASKEDYSGSYLIGLRVDGRYYVGPVNPVNKCLITLYDPDDIYWHSPYGTYLDAIIHKMGYYV